MENLINSKITKKAIEILQDNSYKVTKGRIAILVFFLKNHKPLTIDNIKNSLDIKIDKVTLYRAVNDFVSKGILNKINLGDMAAYYEISNTEHHHHHIICESCGLVEDIEDCHGTDMERKTLNLSKSFSKINSHSLEFFGLCNKCTK